MVVFSCGGEEPDPDKPRREDGTINWRPATTCEVRCAAAVEAWQRDQHAAREAINAKHADHMATVTAPWPLLKLVKT
jgi:hypothetical protein